MIVFDANVLLYAYHTGSESHLVCRRFLEKTLSGTDSVGFCWQSIVAFLRIGTNPRVFSHPFSPKGASAIVSVWLSHPSVALIEPGERFWEILSNLIETAQVTGPLMTDASLAAHALENGATICTTDRDFKKFPALKIIDPTSDPN